MGATDLKGIHVLVTRPAHQAQGVCQALEKLGATTLSFPVLEITDPQDLALAEKTVQQLDRYHWLIFISANAVDYAFSLLKKRGVTLPEGCKIAAVGRSTANKLQQMSIKNVVLPAQQFDSEGLLALPEFADVSDQKILIVRGEGGRETLAEILRQRGAEVDYLAVYRRVKPNTKLDGIEKKSIDIAIVTSNQSVQNLWQMAGKRHQRWLKSLPLVVMSERNRECAKKIGYQGDIIVAATQSDEGLLAAVVQWQKIERARKSAMADKKDDASIKANKPSPAKAGQPQLTTSKTKKPPQKGLITLLVWLVTIVLISVAGYFIWQQQQKIESSIIQKADENRLFVTEQIEQLEQALSNKLTNELKNSNEQLAALRQVLDTLQQENSLLWQNLRKMEQKNGADKRPWQLAEAAYLLRLANHRLQLQGDTEGALIGLQSADLILKQMADPVLLPVREQIARELTQLKMVEEVDIEGISAQLMGLAESARKLPIKGAQLVESQQSEEVSTEPTGEGWQGIVSRVWGELRSLVVITHHDKLIAPLIPAAQQSYLYHNIELQLETARMALFKGDQQIWLSSLSHARNWLNDYFDHEVASVKSTLESINQLEKIEISPALPDISRSLRTLQQQREQLKKSSSPVISTEGEAAL
ncbi:MAG: uroporphyrinogen-III C-methyltransferase [Gammaproteobacteria bacterium]|nr:uroporphyrinogen-III C-methyltransferase [Gammaproteobacteria bacterium]MCF6230606.1 uroporphyrinogen-III C-methyltransferase [Gammaproteobacteria bacterium]